MRIITVKEKEGAGKVAADKEEYFELNPYKKESIINF